MHPIAIACITAALSLLIPANNAFTPSALTSPESICSTTPRPAFCGFRPIDAGTFHDYARNSFHYSFFLTHRLLYPLVDDVFYRFWEAPGSVSPENRMLCAIESCEALIRENKKILFQTYQVIKCRDKVENPLQAQSLNNSLGSVLRNHESCFSSVSGAAASANSTITREMEDLLTHLSMASEAYNATLVLFRLGWGQHQDQITLHSAA